MASSYYPKSHRKHPTLIMSAVIHKTAWLIIINLVTSSLLCICCIFLRIIASDFSLSILEFDCICDVALYDNRCCWFPWYPCFFIFQMPDYIQYRKSSNDVFDHFVALIVDFLRIFCLLRIILDKYLHHFAG
jgi:hypothetical protein